MHGEIARLRQWQSSRSNAQTAPALRRATHIIYWKRRSRFVDLRQGVAAHFMRSKVRSA